MYTIKTLSAINQNYCYSHKVTQVDVDNVNAMVEAIENVFGYRLFDKVQFDGQVRTASFLVNEAQESLPLRQ